MPTITKIVTHAGTFHADEICAVSLLLILYPNTPVERTYTPSEADFNDPTVVVLDIGCRYEPELNNYDHHQDRRLPAASTLVLRHFWPLENIQVAWLLDEYFFRYISDVDTGAIVENENGRISPPTISGIIRSLNSLPKEISFDTACDLMYHALRGQIESARARVRGEMLWGQVKKNGRVALWDSTEFIVGWQDHAERDGINFLITPNLRGGYQITSRDSRAFPIPEHPSQTFLHNSRFTASYPTFDEAFDHALSFA